MHLTYDFFFLRVHQPKKKTIIFSDTCDSLEKPKKILSLKFLFHFPCIEWEGKKSSIKITNDKIFHVTNARKTRINWDQDYFH